VPDQKSIRGRVNRKYLDEILGLNTPNPMKVEHEKLHGELEKATKEKGPLGEAAKAVAKVLHPLFVKEEDYALPPLGLLNVLAEGRVSAKMNDALAMTMKWEANLDQMLKEHKQIISALEGLAVEAKSENKLEYFRFVEKLVLHAQIEEEVYYPASILIGKYLELKLKK
jgi:hypothetical protein